MKAKWYGIYTRPNWEKKVAELLNRRGIDTYYPTTIVQSRHNFRIKSFEKPLFPSYVFAKAAEDQLDSIRNCSGVINLLFWLGKPVVIQDSEIEVMKAVSSKNLDVKIQKTKINFKKINDGPKISSLEVAGRKTFKITLSSIGYHMITEIELPKLTIISSLQNNYTSYRETELLN